MNTIMKSIGIIWLALACLNTTVWAATSGSAVGCPAIYPNCNAAPDIGPSVVAMATALFCGIFLMRQRKLKDSLAPARSGQCESENISVWTARRLSPGDRPTSINSCADVARYSKS